MRALPDSSDWRHDASMIKSLMTSRLQGAMAIKLIAELIKKRTGCALSLQEPEPIFEQLPANPELAALIYAYAHTDPNLENKGVGDPVFRKILESFGYAVPEPQTAAMTMASDEKENAEENEEPKTSASPEETSSELPAQESESGTIPQEEKDTPPAAPKAEAPASDNAPKRAPAPEIPAIPEKVPGPVTREDAPDSIFRKNRHQLLGYIRKTNGFFNFHPVCDIEEKNLTDISNDQARGRFPAHGAFSLGKDIRGPAKRIIPDYFYLMAVDERNDLIPYKDENGVQRADFFFKCDDFQKIADDGRFQPVDAENAYLVVYPLIKSGQLPGDTPFQVTFRKGGDSPQDAASSYCRRIPVLVFDGRRYLGPFPLTVTAAGTLTVCMNATQNGGIITCFEGEGLRKALCTTTAYIFNSGDIQGVWVERDIFFTTFEGVHESHLDCLTDEALLRRLSRVCGQCGGKTAPEVEKWLSGLGPESSFDCADPQIREQRRVRLRGMLDRLKRDRQSADSYAKMIESCFGLLAEKNTRAIERIAECVAKRPKALENLAELKPIREVIAKNTTEKKQLETEVRKLRAEIQNLSEKRDEENERAIQSTREKRETAERELAETLGRLGVSAELSELQDLRDSLSSEVKTLSAHRDSLKNEAESIGDYLSETVSSENIKRLAFEPAVARRFSEAAALWEREEGDRDAAARAKLLETFRPSSVRGEALVQYLVKETAKRRSYDWNTILNLYVCLSQNFLTVLSGLPGTGKTSLCEIIADVLGLGSVTEAVRRQNPGVTLPNESLDRFLPVSVERGWTSKRDFIGYWNPLSKTFETPDSRRYECFRMLDRESETGFRTLPYVVLLDEANLSQMEYYWADFMNVCDGRKGSNDISLGDGSPCRIPDTLRFLATINCDQTTEALSPRLLDRAFIVTLPEADSGDEAGFFTDETELQASAEVIDWRQLSSVFAPDGKYFEKHKGEISPVLGDLKRVFREEFRAPLSARSLSAVCRYVSCAGKWMKAEKQGYGSISAAFDFAVSEKLLPLICLTGDEAVRGLEALKAVCDRHGLARSSETVKRMLVRGGEMGGLYSFF